MPPSPPLRPRLLRPRLSVAAIAAASLAACGDIESIGFTLPAGDPERGRMVFVDMACNDCHSIVGDPEMREEVWASMNVRLGGPTTRIVTYGDLVTSIINPSHRVSERYQTEDFVTEEGESRMRNYNQVMTVDQLIDLVAFLEDSYDLVEYPGTPYQQYVYP